ncbi:TIGR02117 family protein [Pseudomonadota bacterium]
MKPQHALALVLLFISACSSKPYITEPIESATNLPSNTVYVVSHGWHTGFVIPAEGISEHFPQLRERFPNAPYIEFGWGDKGFYQAKEITSGLTLRAIFSPTESVVHAVAVPQDIRRYFAGSEMKQICLGANGYHSLVSFISSSFRQDENGELAVLKNGIYGDSQFYQGVGDYYLMNTCNKWTAKGLKSAGLDISPTFKLTAGSIMDYISGNTPPYTESACH